MKEIWKPLKGLGDVDENRYAVSNMGRVFDSKLKKYTNANDNGAGYKTTALQSGKNLRVKYIHRLVAHVFIENPDNLPQVGHKDHTRSNNVVDNLYWTTQSQNTRDGVAAGRINSKKRPNTKKLSKEQVCEIALMRHQGMGVSQIAAKLDFPRTTISSVMNGRSNGELFSLAQQEIEAHFGGH